MSDIQQAVTAALAENDRKRRSRFWGIAIPAVVIGGVVAVIVAYDRTQTATANDEIQRIKTQERRIEELNRLGR